MGRTEMGALGNKNFRYFFMGQFISLMGTWMQSSGQSWLVLSLTNSPLLLSLVPAFQTLPMFLFSIFAGVIIDRYKKKKLLLITQTASMILAFSLSSLVLFGHIKYYQIIVLATMLGITNTIDNPTRQTFVRDMVGDDNILSAIALNSSLINFARIVGPSIAGIMMGWVGAGWCFFINGVSFIPVIYGIYKIDIDGEPKALNNKNGVFKDIKEGFIYIKSNFELILTIMLIGIVSCFLFNFNVIIPIIAKEKLNMDATGYGMLMAAMGLGACIAAVFVARYNRKIKIKYVYMLGIIEALLFILLSFTDSIALNIIIIVFIGAAMVLFSSIANTNVQLMSQEEYRGRVMSIYTLVFIGITPIGSTLTGQLITLYKIDFALIICSFICIILVILLILLRIRYLKMK